MTNIFTYKQKLTVTEITGERFIENVLEIFEFEHTILESIRHHNITIEDGDGNLRCIIDLENMDKSVKNILLKIIFKSPLDQFKCVEFIYNDKIIFYPKK